MKLKRTRIGPGLFKGITVLVVWTLVQAAGPVLVAESAGHHSEPAIETLDASVSNASDIAKRQDHQVTSPGPRSAEVDQLRLARCRLERSLQPTVSSGSVSALKGRDPPLR